LSDLYFTDIGVLHEIAYETGVGITTVLFDPKEDTANILLRYKWKLYFFIFGPESAMISILYLS
jgi:hypothetical protein